MRQIWLIAQGVLIEAVRRKEIYAIVLVSLLLIAGIMTVDFFKLEGISKFYREAALKIMSVATAVTTIILATRQLPREFENRTVYPLLAKPVSRYRFLLGKLLGVLLAACFCFALFMVIFVIGSKYLEAPVPWGLTLQYIYLQVIMLMILASLAFWLSLLVNLDAAITAAMVFYATSSIISSASLVIFEYLSGVGQWLMRGAIFLLPQLTLFDLSGKTVHPEAWSPLDAVTMVQLSLYGMVFITVYTGLAYFCFSRRAL